MGLGVGEVRIRGQDLSQRARRSDAEGTEKKRGKKEVNAETLRAQRKERKSGKEKGGKKRRKRKSPTLKKRELIA